MELQSPSPRAQTGHRLAGLVMLVLFGGPLVIDARGHLRAPPTEWLRGAPHVLLIIGAFVGVAVLFPPVQSAVVTLASAIGNAWRGGKDA